ncbi:hypothetical protein [Streptomyces sp. NPDC050535]|uniref:hypothetical protein n=1 Tax=Streptomyces sp. NPDC050535 TaxID=3365626 RepID=UPI0037A4E600
MGDQVMLRALAQHLGLDVALNALHMSGSAERIAAVRLEVWRRLGSQHVALALDHADFSLTRHSGRDTLSELIETGVLDKATVIVARRAGNIQPTPRMRVRSQISLMPLSYDEAGRMLAEESCLSAQTCEDACSLVDHDVLQPGTLITALQLLEGKASDQYVIAEALLKAAKEDAYEVGLKLLHAVEEADSWVDWVLLISSTIIGPCSCHSPLDIPEEWGRVLFDGHWMRKTEGAPSPEKIFLRMIPRIISATIETLPQSSSEAFELLVSHVVRQAPREVLEETLVRVTESPRTSVWSAQITRDLMDAVARTTSGESLGPVIPATLAAGLPSSSPLNAAEILFLARNSPRPRDFRQRLMSGKSLSLSVSADDEAGIDLVRLALRELDLRYDFDGDVEAVRREVLHHFGISPVNVAHRSAYLQIALDSCETSIRIGDSNFVAGMLDRLRMPYRDDLSWTKRRAPIPGATLERIRAEAQILAVLTRRVQADDVLPTLRDSWSVMTAEGGGVISAVTSRTQFVRAAVITGAAPDVWMPELHELFSAVENYSKGTSRAIAASRVAAAVRMAAEAELALVDRAEMLSKAYALIIQHEDDLRFLARSGDNRPLLALARLVLALSRAQSRSVNRAQRRRGEESSNYALSLLKWVTAETPSAAAWWTYLRCLASVGVSTDEDEENPENDVFSSDSDPLRKELASYRRWAKSRRISSSRDIQIDLWALSRRWASEGSLIAVAKSDYGHRRWMRRPIDVKLQSLAAVYEKRRAELDRRESVWGPRPELVLPRFRMEAQYQRSAAICEKNREPDNEPVLEILNQGLERWGPVPELAVLKAQFLRYIWNLEEALDELATLENSAWGDAYTARRYRILYADVLVIQARDRPGNGMEQCERAVLLLGGLQDTDWRAAMVSMTARLEVDKCLPSLLADDMADLFWRQGPYTASWADGSSPFRDCAELLAEEGAPYGMQVIAEDFTNPRILLKYASLLVRSFELRSNPRLNDLGAALTVSEGARIMAPGLVENPTLAFLQGRSLLLACEASESPEPLRWARRTGSGSVSDIALACRLLASASSRSVGSFRSLIGRELARALRLQKMLLS